MAPILVINLSNWFTQHINKYPQNNMDENSNGINLADADEKLLELACHIIKKCWSLLVEASVFSEEAVQSVDCFIRSLCWLSVKVSLLKNFNFFRIFLFLIEERSFRVNKQESK